MLNSGISELENRQRRELRRQRTDELRAGLATLGAAYRDRLAPDPVGAGRPNLRRLLTLKAVKTSTSWPGTCNTTRARPLQLQALLARLGRLEV